MITAILCLEIKSNKRLYRATLLPLTSYLCAIDSVGSAFRSISSSSRAVCLSVRPTETFGPTTATTTTNDDSDASSALPLERPAAHSPTHSLHRAHNSREAKSATKCKVQSAKCKRAKEQKEAKGAKKKRVLQPLRLHSRDNRAKVTATVPLINLRRPSHLDCSRSCCHQHTQYPLPRGLISFPRLRRPSFIALVDPFAQPTKTTTTTTTTTTIPRRTIRIRSQAT